MSVNAVEAARRRIDAEASKLEQFASHGKCKDFEQYKDVTGRARGMRDALGWLEEAVKSNHDGD